MINWNYFEIVAKEVHNEKITAVYIKSKRDNTKEPELWTVVIVNFSNETVSNPAYLGSYMAFRAPAEILNIEPYKDNLDRIKERVSKLPRKELNKITEMLISPNRKGNTNPNIINENSILNEEAEGSNEPGFGNILDEEIEEYLTELAARYNYYYQQKMLSKKLDKTIRKECTLTDNLVFELAGLCFKKYFGR